jgi:hypothetical protein
MNELIRLRKVWTVTRYPSQEAYQARRPAPVIDGKTGGVLPAVSTFEGNVLLNEGIAVLITLLLGTGGTHFGNANAYLGVGDDNTAAAAAQTGLQALTNKLYKAMEATYPQVASQTVTWRSEFGAAEANFAWNEFTVANGNSDASTNLNRKVDAQGTKTSGQIWTLDLAITFS